MPKQKREIFAQRALTRARVLRDQTVRSIIDIQSIAALVDADQSPKEELSVRIENLESLFKRFQDHQDDVLNALIELDDVDEYSVDQKISNTVENSYYGIRAVAARVFPAEPRSSSASNTLSASTSSASVVSLPKIELPKFDGNLTQWRSFRDKFVSLIRRNSSLSSTDQFHYQLSCLSGPALSIINSLPLTENNYDIAWSTLSSRYENQRLLATAHMEKLFAFRPINSESLSALLTFATVFQENIAAIKALGIVDLSDFMLFFIGSRLLDPITRQLFEGSVSQDTVPTFDTLLKFVHQRCRVLENIRGSEKTETRYQRAKPVVTYRSSNVAATDVHKSISQTSQPRSGSTYFDKNKVSCVYCKNTHAVYKCHAFAKLSVNKRRDFVLSSNLCFSCMSPKHRAAACPSKVNCKFCNRRHHSLLHLAEDTQEQTNIVNNDIQVSQMTSSTSTEPQNTVFSGSVRAISTVVLGTAIVHIKDHQGYPQAVRVLLDSGSQISAMTSECASRLNLPIHKCHTNIVGISHNPVTKVKGITSCTFAPQHCQEVSFECEEVFILPNITPPMPSDLLPASVRNQYQHLTLADPTFDVPSRVDMLVGGDIFPYIVRPCADIVHNPGHPSALDTQLGWVIVGPLSTPHSSSPISLAITSTTSLDSMLRQFWTIEEPCRPEIPTTENELCEKWFIKNTSRHPSGKFCVALPFRDEVTFLAPKSRMSPTAVYSTSSHGLGDSRSLAMKRFFNLEKRLHNDPVLYDSYRKFMNEYLSLGHMKLATEPGKYFIPHHAVLRQDGDVSKLRVVFDASASSTSGVSLNDVLCVGPKLQMDIKDILLRCRLNKYVFTADIEKMYRQIFVKPADRLYQHIFWRNSSCEAVQEYELMTVTYGVSSAPYLAIRCLHKLDALYGNRFPLAKGILTEMTYVDDIVVGADSEDKLIEIQKQIISLLRLGGCRLKKWTSNCAVILGRVPRGTGPNCFPLIQKTRTPLKY